MYVGFATLHQQMGEAADDADRLADGTGDLAATRRLADGARQVADGNRRLYDTAAPIADRIIDAIDDLPSADSVSAELNRLAEQCRTSPSEETGGEDFCAGLSRAAGRLSAIAGDIDGMKARAGGGAAEIKQSLGKLAGGAEHGGSWGRPSFRARRSPWSPAPCRRSPLPWPPWNRCCPPTAR
ncbi:hypothetical protein C1I98_04035 [Spongiactinospora gelatinilytica]|uniref:Uncharacterized protein n=1 Tax=Spongiactinospora gelatinilytica TaxID=2666298 RepID=A0A2W2H1W3_9ACTN|nr:hypothetical protein [Spongiactinospora gelatinilytica]PZG54432.1 hypothetical protein C1I98_04035 [Spongiactinospora gelatinilytica]